MSTKRAMLFAPMLVALTASGVLANDGGRSDGHEGDGQRPFTIAVIGDTPYGAPQIANFANDISEINADGDVSLILHLGDIKNGSSRCDTAYFQTILATFQSSTDPFVYTPGDNEWTDCHRTNNGSYVPTERLATIRQLFFPRRNKTLGVKPATVQSQKAPTVENVTWKRRDIRFVTIDLPGSNNSWLPWSGLGFTSQTADQIAETTTRTAADIAWLDRAFAEARDDDAAAIVIGLQADMWDPAFSGSANDLTQYDQFTSFVRDLAAQARRFHGPVLLFNGDSHRFTDDFPLSSTAPAYQLSMYGITTPVENLRRITVNGSTTPCHEWLKLTIDPSSATPFNYTRIAYHTQPGFDHAVCPES